MFGRHPLERVLSAYRDKIQPHTTIMKPNQNELKVRGLIFNYILSIDMYTKHTEEYDNYFWDNLVVKMTIYEN